MSNTIIIVAVLLIIGAIVAIIVNFTMGGTVGTKRGRFGRRVLDARPPAPGQTALPVAPVMMTAPPSAAPMGPMLMGSSGLGGGVVAYAPGIGIGAPL
jgi:hypothetical protein